MSFDPTEITKTLRARAEKADFRLDNFHRTDALYLCGLIDCLTAENEKLKMNYETRCRISNDIYEQNMRNNLKIQNLIVENKELKRIIDEKASAGMKAMGFQEHQSKT